MNFITDMSPNEFRNLVYDFILMIIDRFIKYARYIPAKMNGTVDQITNVLFDEIFIRLDILESITTDRGMLFTSNYGFDFCYYLKVKLRYNIAFHLQTDDQTKKQNQILKQYFRCYVNYQQNDGARGLSVTKYVYNNNGHSTIKLSPFQTLYEEALKGKDQIVDEREQMISATKKKAIKMLFLKQKLTKKLKNARNNQIKYYDQKHIFQIYKIENQVLLSAKNIATTRSFKKLNYKFFGPFEIIKPIEKQTYRLHLFKNFKFVHNVFHVFLLKPYKKKSNEKMNSVMIHDQKQGIIEKILNNRMYYDKLQYLVKGKKCIEKNDEYIPVKELKRTKKMIKNFHSHYSEKPAKRLKNMLKTNTSSKKNGSINKKSTELKEGLAFSEKKRSKKRIEQRYKKKRVRKN